MNHRPVTPPKIALGSCTECGAALAIVFLRLLRKQPPAYKCLNTAACRKRQRQRAVQEKSK